MSIYIRPHVNQIKSINIYFQIHKPSVCAKMLQLGVVKISEEEI